MSDIFDFEDRLAELQYVLGICNRRGDGEAQLEQKERILIAMREAINYELKQIRAEIKRND